MDDSWCNNPSLKLGDEFHLYQCLYNTDLQKFKAVQDVGLTVLSQNAKNR